jgi:iron(III) transport system substrate-binding protein
MKRLLGVTLVMAVALGFAGCKGNTKTVADGGPSGKLLIYTSIYEDIIEAMDRELDKAFPNLDVRFFYGGTGQIQSMVSAEETSGRLGADMLMVAEPSYSLELKEKGMLHPFASPEASSLAFEYDPEGYWYPVRISNMVLAFNPELYSRDQVPSTFYDFANDPSLKGVISMGNPLTSGTAMASVAALKDKYGYEYFQALGNQNVMVESGSVALTKLETGECTVIMVLEESVLKKRDEDGSLLEVIYPTDGTIVIPSTVAIVNEDWNANNNIEAAEAVANWFLSPAGQNAVVDGWMHSAREGFPRLPFDAIPTAEIRANSMPVNWENVFRQRAEIRERFEELVMTRQ